MQEVVGIHNFLTLQNAIKQNCEDIVTVKNLQLEYMFCNDAFFNLFGIDKNFSIIGKKPEDVLKIEKSQIISKICNKVIKTKNSASVIFRIEKELSSQIIKTIVYPVFEHSHMLGILCVSRDITDEENIKLKLVEKICIINSLLENIPMIAFMKDKKNNYVVGSKHSKKFHNCGIDFYKRNVKLDFNEYQEEILSEDKYVLENKKSIVKEKSFVSTIGSEHWYKIHKSPVYDIKNEINGVITVAQNLDAEKQLEAQKELFLATLTHDLKNPIQAQLSSLQLFKKGKFGAISESQKEVLGMLIESTSFMKEMLQSILYTYKYEKGMVKLHKKEFDINKLIDICLKEAENFASEKNIIIEYTNKTNSYILNADESQIRRVITNMLNNAINYAFKNTKIIVSFEEVETKFLIKIKNSSEPIPDSIKRKIFDKYVAATTSQLKKGIGLGLYFCKKVIDAHNGNIVLNTNKNQNEFTVELPKIITKDVTINFH